MTLLHRYTLMVHWAVLCITTVFMQTANAAETPNAGTLQQQINPQLPATPSQQNIVIPQSDELGVQDNTPFTVKNISIDGNVSIDTVTLYDLVKSYEGETHTITDMQQACKKITEYYRAQGYSFARAVLPQQEITDGRVRIQVIEAKYGAININNQSRISTDLIERTIASLIPGKNIEQRSLDRALLLLSDMPSTSTIANIKPGQTFGESDFDLDFNALPAVNARLVLDSFGNRFIHRPRLVGSINVNNPLNHGDVLSVNYLTTGERMRYAQVNYDWLLNGLGTHVGASYANLYYKLGEELQRLDVHGTADTTEAWIKHPLLRGRHHNLFTYMRAQHNVLKDRTDATNIKNDRTVDSLVFSVNGDIRDGILGGGINSYFLSYSQGRVDIDNAAAKLRDASAANTHGHYAKWNYNLNRLQSVTDRLQLWGSITGQVAQDNLDPSQKMVFGGPYSVRAYDNGTVSGDHGTLMTVEARYLISQWMGTWQGVAFYDSGVVEINDQQWRGNTGKNKAHLAGVGLGIQWYGPHQLFSRAFMATSTSNDNTLTAPGDKQLVWFEIAKNF